MAATFDADQVDTTLRSVLSDVLGLERSRVNAFEADTALFGSLPEFDSMAVAGVLTELEERLAILIQDDEVDGELFENYGNLLTFTKAKALT